MSTSGKRPLERVLGLAGELVDLLPNGLSALPCLFLEISFEPLPLSFEAIHVVAGQVSPHLLYLPLELLPVSFGFLLLWAIHGD